MDWRMNDRGLLCRVSPFRNLRVVGYLLLTAAYRSLSRLSSALSAKASTLRSYQLDLYSRILHPCALALPLPSVAALQVCFILDVCPTTSALTDMIVLFYIISDDLSM